MIFFFGFFVCYNVVRPVISVKEGNNYSFVGNNGFVRAVFVADNKLEFRVIAEAVFLKYVYVSEIFVSGKFISHRSVTFVGVAEHKVDFEISVCDKFVYDFSVDRNRRFVGRVVFRVDKIIVSFVLNGVSLVVFRRNEKRVRFEIGFSAKAANSVVAEGMTELFCGYVSVRFIAARATYNGIARICAGCAFGCTRYVVMTQSFNLIYIIGFSAAFAGKSGVTDTLAGRFRNNSRYIRVFFVSERRNDFVVLIVTNGAFVNVFSYRFAGRSNARFAV